MICPKCGENNSDNFRFCGMCGTPLDARPPASAAAMPKPPSSATPTPAPAAKNTQAAPRVLVVENVPRPVNPPVPPISGPSMLGLSQPTVDQVPASEPFPKPAANQTYADSLPAGAFSGMDSFLEPEQPRTGGRRLLLLIVLLAALGAAGWWTYTYVRDTESRKAEVATESGNEPGNKTATNNSYSAKPSAQGATPAPDAGSQQAASASGAVAEGPSENATRIPDTTPTTTPSQPKPAPKPTPARPKTTQPKATPPKSTRPEKIAEKRETSVAPAKPPKVTEAEAGGGDADFRRGEAYLYGRGVPENCAEAVKNLKAASAKSNAKARSAFGTMYATGHCVARDLPTSYLWFALALRVDPSNQILEKDLNAVWNQMTPPERQQATRMKQ